jgi:hypothetical protein
MKTELKIHHSQLDENEKDTYVCNACGSEDVSEVADCSVCADCHSVEDTETAYWVLDGELYRDSEIDWTGVPCIKCLFPKQTRVINGMTTIANHDNLPKIENTDTDETGRCVKHPTKQKESELFILAKSLALGIAKVNK